MWKRREAAVADAIYNLKPARGVRNYVWKAAAPDAFRLLLLIFCSFCARGAFETGDFVEKTSNWK
jgi:hypothetical protein